jgi:hypothetical protein
MPSYVVDDIIEVLYNILQGNCKLNKRQIQLLRKHKAPLTKFYSNVSKEKKRRNRQIIYKQSGGFIGGILPIITSVLSGLVGSAI